MTYIDDNLYRLSAEEIEKEIASLPPQRREAVNRYHHELGRRQGLLAYQLLCRGLREEYGICQPPVFTYGEYGKPYLAHYPHIFFSLSHSKNAVACAISTRPIGIDIESIRPVKEAVVRYAMNAEEANAILSSPMPDMEFSRLWTRKEAVLKLTGRGINENMRNVLVDNNAVIETTLCEHYIYSIAQYERESSTLKSNLN